MGGVILRPQYTHVECAIDVSVTGIRELITCTISKQLDAVVNVRHLKNRQTVWQLYLTVKHYNSSHYISCIQYTIYLHINHIYIQLVH